MKYVAAGMDFVAAGRKNAVFVQKTGPAATKNQLRFHQTASA